MFATLACIRTGQLEMAAGHLATAREIDALPSLLGLAIDAARQGRDDDAESLCRHCRQLLAEEAGLSRRDVFICSALQGLLASEGDGPGADSGRLAVQIGEEALAAADSPEEVRLGIVRPPLPWPTPSGNGRGGV